MEFNSDFKVLNRAFPQSYVALVS